MIRLLIAGWSKDEKRKLLTILKNDMYEMDHDEECMGNCCLCKYYSICVDLRATVIWLEENI